MAQFCTRCGVSLPTSANFCPSCGNSTIDDGSERKEFPPTSSLAGLPESVITTLCYSLTFVTGIIFLNLDPFRKNPGVRFHAWQSILFGMTWTGIFFIEKIFVTYLFPFLWFLMPFVHIGMFVMWILLMIKAYNGEKYKLPIAGEIAEHRANPGPL